MKKILFVLSLIAMIVVYAFFVNNDLSGSLVRFHVIANSDTDVDQKLKLKVRDAVIYEADTLLCNSKSKYDTVKLITDNKNKLLSAAKKTVKDEGFDYDVDIEYGEFYFPKKSYKNISLPSGRYDAIKVKIGEAKGKNWWCVMFPPLCLSEDGGFEMDSESIEYLKNSLTKSEYEMLTENEDLPVKIRFKTVDMVMKLSEKLKSLKD